MLRDAGPVTTPEIFGKENVRVCKETRHSWMLSALADGS
jgi:hypothetical protein